MVICNLTSICKRVLYLLFNPAIIIKILKNFSSRRGGQDRVVGGGGNAPMSLSGYGPSEDGFFNCYKVNSNTQYKVLLEDNLLNALQVIKFISRSGMDKPAKF